MTLRTTLATFSLLSLWATLMSGCYSPTKNAVACEAGSLCDNGQRCTDGSCGMTSLDASPLADACGAAMCVGDQLVGCGQSPVCGLGCAAASPGSDAHCIELKPSNGFNDWSITDGTASLTAVTELIVNTDTGAIAEAQLGGATIRSAGLGLRDGIYFATTPGGQLSVFAMQQLTIAEGATLRLVGGPAVVLLVNSDAVVAGRIDASGGLNKAHPMGPGGGLGGDVVAAAGGGCGGGMYGSTSDIGTDGGGGGGGMRDVGGGGGGDTLGGAGGAGGASCIITDLQPLRGGSGTGGAGLAMSGFGFGGHGGGAVQISVRNRLVIESTGSVVASGGGGGGGRFVDSTGGGGGGGGAGGGILLEASSVVAAGNLFANGGGGGGGAANSMTGNDGEPGQESPIPAQGGAIGGGGTGGAGGTNMPPRDGRNGAYNSGGGGGSAGVIVVRGGDAIIIGIMSPTVSRLPIVTQ